MHEKNFRRCVACRKTKHQNEMLRLACVGETYLFDYDNRLGGRGAYVCKSEDCIKLTIKKKQFNRAFKSNVPNEIYERLQEYAQNNKLSRVCEEIK